MDIWVAFIQTVLAGVLAGGFIAITAVGFSIFFTVCDILNFAHGSFIMLGAFVAFTLYTSLSTDVIFSMLVAGVLTGIVGYVLFRYLVVPVTYSPSSVVMITLGLMYVLEWCLIVIFGNVYVSIPSSILARLLGSEVLAIGSLSFRAIRVEVFLVSILLFATTYILLTRTDIGKALRGTMQDTLQCELYGINTKTIYGIAIFLGFFLTGVGGAYIPAMEPTTPTVGFIFVNKAFAPCAVAVVKRNINYAFYGSILIGVAENIVTFFLPSSLRDIVSVVLVTAILLAVPWKPLKKSA
jgi:branched-chain amino acid transport system permease protein